MSGIAGIALGIGDFVLIPASNTGINLATPNSISQGEIVDAYSNQMAYSIGDTIAYDNKAAIFFNYGGVTYSVVNQNDVFFKILPT